MDYYIFWSEIGSGFEESGGTPPPRISRSPPPPFPGISSSSLNVLYNIIVCVFVTQVKYKFNFLSKDQLAKKEDRILIKDLISNK